MIVDTFFVHLQEGETRDFNRGETLYPRVDYILLEIIFLDCSRLDK